MSAIQTKKVLNLAGAEAIMSVAEAQAHRQGSRVVIAVVDFSGDLLLLRRLEGTQVASVNVAIDKARTAAIFVRSSRVLEEQVSEGRLGALALHGAAPLTGGIPLVVDDEVVGAIGTSGETPDEDEAISIAGSQIDFAIDEVKALTYEGAQIVAHAAASEATARGVAPVVSVVDSAGELIYVWRPDAAQVASVNVATDKARTAAIFRRPSKAFEDQASQGRPSALALARGVPLQGGVPLVVDNHVVGAIGVSGASSAPEDSELAEIGAKALAAVGAKAPVYIPHDDVAAKFATGGFMLETADYIVDAGRREAGGDAEMHNSVTDIMYIQEGTATMLAGGAMVDVREVASGDFRGRTIEGGTTYQLSKGDVFIAPNGVPHQFIEASKPFLYYVIKVIHGV